MQMKIAMISKSNRKGGGASRVAEDLAEWLNKEGHPTHHYCARILGEPREFQRPLYGCTVTKRLIQLTHFTTRNLGFSEVLPMEYIFGLAPRLKQYDIVHFHDLHTTISPLTVQLASRCKPTLFTIHDFSAFTGGCIYPLNCHQFLNHCSTSNMCSIVRSGGISDYALSFSHKIRKRVAESNVTYIFPSQWMANRARTVLRFRNRHHVIHNGIDDTDFHPLGKCMGRRRLDLPRERPIIAISAFDMSDIRKGVGYACDTVLGIRELSPLVVLVGKPDRTVSKRLEGIDHIFTGYIDEPQKMALIYSAADVLLFCSLSDNLPLTVLEAMAVGTPVVGFSSGGVPEMVVHNVTGFLSEPFDTQSLSAGLRSFIQGDYGQTWGNNARLRFEQKFSKTRFLEQHIQLYEQLHGLTQNSWLSERGTHARVLDKGLE